MRALRIVTGLGLGSYGASYLWLAPAAVPGAAGPLWAVVEVLVVATAAGFIVAGWGLARTAPWAERMMTGAAVAGLLTLIPYLVASQDIRSGGTAVNAALHALGCAAVLLGLSVPPAERLLSRRARHG
jgi:dipeptide/tripeptide permease